MPDVAPELVTAATAIVAAVRGRRPLVHRIGPGVTAPIVANGLLAAGARPLVTDTADEAPALGRDQRPRADLGQPGGDVDRSAFRATSLELRDDLQHGAPSQRMRLGRRQGELRAGTQGGVHCSKGPSAWHRRAAGPGSW